MRRILTEFEDDLDPDVLDGVRRLCRRLKAAVLRLGEDPREDDLVPLVEEFVFGILALDAEHGFVTAAEAAEIRAWYEEFAAERGLPVAELDDLEGVDLDW